MNIDKVFKESFDRARSKGWDYIVVLIDIHDTIFKACWDKPETYEYLPFACMTLQEMSKRNDIKMVLWSSSYPEKLQAYYDRLTKDDIHFDYVNKFPEAMNSNTGCFDQKMFFNVGIDNAFGFETEDWLDVWCALKKYNIYGR